MQNGVDIFWPVYEIRTKIAESVVYRDLGRSEQIPMKKRSERRKHCALPLQAGSVLLLCTKFEADSYFR